MASLTNMNYIKIIAAVIALLAAVSTPAQTLPSTESVRVKEFYRLTGEIQDKVWTGWSQTAAPILLITKDLEFLIHFPNPPKQFAGAGDDVYTRARQFPPNLQATFPAFGPPSVIAVGTAEETDSKTSTAWLLMLMHEHFHQLQDSQPDFYKKVDELGLSHGDSSGMWMLNFPFPYEKPAVAESFAKLRDLLLRALKQPDETSFGKLAQDYLRQRHAFFAKVSPEERKYFEFQLWKEGIARYTEVKCAEVAAHYQPSVEFSRLPDYKPFASEGADARQRTLAELKQTDLAKSKRISVYAFGAAEGFFLDRYKPNWKNSYFEHPFSMNSYFGQ